MTRDTATARIASNESRGRIALTFIAAAAFAAMAAFGATVGRLRERTWDDLFGLGVVAACAAAAAGFGAWLLLGRWRWGERPLEVLGRLALGERVVFRLTLPPTLDAGTPVKLRVVATSYFKPGKHVQVLELWSAERRAVVPARGAPSLEFTLDLPADQQPAQRIPSGEVRWSATVHADVTGVDLWRSYDLPVTRARGRHPLVDG